MTSHALPQDFERFIASFNALMEHTAHVEQQLRVEHDAGDVETAEDTLARHVQMQEQLRKAPQNTIREGNDLLRALEQVKGGQGEEGRERACWESFALFYDEDVLRNKTTIGWFSGYVTFHV